MLVACQCRACSRVNREVLNECFGRKDFEKERNALGLFKKRREVYEYCSYEKSETIPVDGRAVGGNVFPLKRNELLGDRFCKTT